MSQFTNADFDAALSTPGDSILPSSGFTASVMSAVQNEASASPAIAFPWMRALPGFAAYVVVVGILTAVCVAGIHASTTHAPEKVSWRTLKILALHDGSSTGIFWLVLSLLIAVLCLVFIRRLANYDSGAFYSAKGLRFTDSGSLRHIHQ